MINSRFLDILNDFLSKMQFKSAFLKSNSLILSRIDNLILLNITLILIFSTFMSSDNLGLTALILIALSVFRLFIEKGEKIQLNTFDGALIVFLLLSFISVIHSTLFFPSLKGFLKTFIYIGFYFSVAQYLKNNKDKIIYFLLLISILCSFESVWAIIQSKLGVLQISTWQDTSYLNPEDVISRAYGTLKPYNPNLLSGYLLAVFSSILTLGFLGLKNAIEKFKLKNIDYSCFYPSFIMFFLAMVGVLAIFQTGSRGAYLGLGTIFISLFLISGALIFSPSVHNSLDIFSKKLRKIWIQISSTLFLLFIGFLLLNKSVLNRILSIFVLREDSSTAFRMNVYKSSMQIFNDNWLFGIGTGNQTFREIYGLYMLSGFDALSSYCVPLEIAVESGILTLLSFLIFIILVLKFCFKFIFNENNISDKIIITGSMLAIIGLMTHGLFDTIFFRPQVQFIFWLNIAIISSYSVQQSQKI